MNTRLDTRYLQEAPQIEQGFDLLEYLCAVIAARTLIFTAALAFATAGLGYSFLQPELFEAYVRTDLVDLDDPGGVSPDNRRASEVLTLVEHGFVLGTTKDNYLDVMLEKLRTRRFSMMFIDKHNLYQHFYADEWDEQTQSWKEDFLPDEGDTFKLFHDEVRFIDHDPETDIISVRFRWSDPELVRDWSNAFVADFNDFMREQALEDVREKRTFLEQELMATDIVDMQQSIYRLIEAQTAVAMLANAREDYALEIIDPALLPLDRFSPGRKTYLVIGGFIGLMLALSYVFGSVALKNLRRTLKQYKALTLSNDPYLNYNQS